LTLAVEDYPQLVAAEFLAEFDNTLGQGVVDVVIRGESQVYLTIGGETAYRVGYDVCDTCAYLFEKVRPANSLAKAIPQDEARTVADLLKDVEGVPKAAGLELIGRIFAPGTYTVLLKRLTPRLVLPGAEDDYFAQEAVSTWGVDPYFGVADSPRTPYYRLGTKPLDDVPYGGRRLGVVLGVPLYPPTQKVMMKPSVVDTYQKALRTKMTRPTVLALGLVDDRGPAVWDSEPTFTRHLIVTLYILDGHHKTFAAADEQMPVQFLVFLPHSYVGREWRERVESGVALLQKVGM
jgi:hypothetical protein